MDGWWTHPGAKRQDQRERGDSYAGLPPTGEAMTQVMLYEKDKLCLKIVQYEPNLHIPAGVKKLILVQNTFKIMLLTIILMMSVAIQDTYSSEHFQYYLKDETPEEASLRVLRRTDPRPTAGSPSPKLSVHFSMGAGPQRNTWWLSPEPYTNRRQRVAYYNLNSFGLRYGKREQSMLAGFKQKIHVK